MPACTTIGAKNPNRHAIVIFLENTMNLDVRTMTQTRSTGAMSRAFLLTAIAGFAASSTLAGVDTDTRSIVGEAKLPQSLALSTEARPMNPDAVRTGKMIVRISDQAGFDSAMQSLQSDLDGLRIVKAIDADSGVYMLDAGSPGAALAAYARLTNDPAVLHVIIDQSGLDARQNNVYIWAREQVMGANATLRSQNAQTNVPVSLQPLDNQTPRGVSTDPLFANQWHFDNGANGNTALQERDNNILASIYTSLGLTGAGVNIGFSNFGVNTHIDVDHTQLDGNYSSNLTMAFDPVLFADSSAPTAWAGIFGAELDGVTIQGVSPNSNFGLFNWPGVADTLPIYESEAFAWKNQDLDIKVFDTSAIGFYSSPVNSYNRGAANDFVSATMINSFAFGRQRKGLVNIFGTGTNLWFPDNTASNLPDPYNFPPMNPTDSWSPIDEWAASQNEISVGLTDGWTSGPYYPNGQVTYYPPANNRRSLIFNTVDENGFADIYSAQGPSIFASFYGSTTNIAQGFSGNNIITTVPGPAGTLSLLPADAMATDGTENMSGPFIGAGVIALMLEANPDLSIRDIQHILYESIQDSTKPANIKWPNFDTARSYYFPYNGDPAFAPPRSFWQVNTALYNSDTVTNQAVRHSDIYGFGMVDAQLAIQKAATWAGTQPLVLLDTGLVGTFNDPNVDTDTDLEIAIPDATFVVTQEPDGATGQDGAAFITPGTVPFPVICVRQNIIIESIVVELTIEGGQGQDLYLALNGPRGTSSILHLPVSNNNAATSYDDVFNDDDVETGIANAGSVNIGGTTYAFYRHEFLTYKHWGELSGGEWTLSVADYGPDTENPEGEPMGTGAMPDPGADMVIALGENGLPGNPARSEKTITGYRFKIFGTESGLPIYEGCNPLQTSCPADLNGDGVIAVLDLQIFLDWYITGNAYADINGDGRVDYFDLVFFRGIWRPGFCNQDSTSTRPLGGSDDAGSDSRPVIRPI
jgi:hypothetical protein